MIFRRNPEEERRKRIKKKAVSLGLGAGVGGAIGVADSARFSEILHTGFPMTWKAGRLNYARDAQKQKAKAYAKAKRDLKRGAARIRRLRNRPEVSTRSMKRMMKLARGRKIKSMAVGGLGGAAVGIGTSLVYDAAKNAYKRRKNKRGIRRFNPLSR